MKLLICDDGDERLEAWQRFPYLRKGYRVLIPPAHASSSWDAIGLCLRSLLRWHNETLNAWTMMASLFVGCCMYVATKPSDAGAVLLLGQILHTPVSVAYHLCMPISREVSARLRNADLAMVVVLNACATWAFSMKTFGKMYASCVDCILLILAALTMMSNNKSRKQIVGLVAFSAMGYYVPIFWNVLHPRLWWGALLVILCHGTSALCYINHWPQSKWPGMFDFGFHSHVIMHVMLFVCYNAGYVYVRL